MRSLRWLTERNYHRWEVGRARMDDRLERRFDTSLGGRGIRGRAFLGTIGGQIIARKIPATTYQNGPAKCPGVVATRQCKLSEKQKVSKRRMRQVDGVELPLDASLAPLKVK